LTRLQLVCTGNEQADVLANTALFNKVIEDMRCGIQSSGCGPSEMEDAAAGRTVVVLAGGVLSVPTLVYPKFYGV